MSGPLETVFDRGPAHILGPKEDGLVYAFFASAEGMEAFKHKQLLALRGVLNAPSRAVDLGQNYIGCVISNLPCRQLQRGTSHPPSMVMTLGRTILETCSSIHDHGLFHGCISAERILLSEKAELMIRDCGAISAITMHSRGLIQARMPGMDRIFAHGDTIPPEFHQEGSCSSQTDIFLIGVLLYELLSGNNPFNAPSTLARYQQVSQGNFNPLAPQYGEFGQWVNQCLHPSPSERPTPAESLALLEQLGSNDDFEPLFATETVLISQTLTSRRTPDGCEPFFASDRENTRALKLWDAQLLARRPDRKSTSQGRRWGSWIAILFIALVTWIFIEMVTSEMRSRSYDGRPGPAPQKAIPNDSNATPNEQVGKRRRLDRGERLPRRPASF